MLPVTVTAAVSGSQIAVSGAARAGSNVVISAGQPTASSDTSVVSAVAGPDGHFRATVPLRAGTNVITATATHGTDATGWAQATVKS